MTLGSGSREFRWGIIGPGRIAEEFATALDVVEGACLYGVASRDKTRAQHFATQFAAQVAFDDYRALIDDPSIDAVYIATPHRFHYAQALACLDAGKAVLCEKPLTVNARETRELIGVSQRSGVFLMEAMRTRYLPIYQQVRRWLDAGRIGSVTSVTSSFGFKFPYDINDRLFDHELAGGALLDLGVYNLCMSQWVFGQQPQSYSVLGQLGDTGVDEHDKISMEYPGGHNSTFEISLTTPLANQLTLHGSTGEIKVGPKFWNATEAVLTTEGSGQGQTIEERACEPFRATGMEYEIEEAMRCIQAGFIESPSMCAADSLSTMELMDELRNAMGLVYSFE